MIDWLTQIDYNILLAINGFHTPFLDTLMWYISEKFTWFPLYLLLFVLVYLKYPLKQAIWFTVFGFLAVGLCDFTTTYLFKETVMRLRPSHNPILSSQLHFYQISPGNLYKGGSYGFFSGHAANSMLIAMFFIYQLQSKFKYILPPLLLWVAIVCYSRMYLGVHYPSDIVCGLIWGWLIAFLFRYCYKKLILKSSNRN